MAKATRLVTPKAKANIKASVHRMDLAINMAAMAKAREVGFVMGLGKEMASVMGPVETRSV